MNVTFERGSARDPRRSPLSTKLNDASAWRIGVPVVQFVMTSFDNDSSCHKGNRTKRVLNHMCFCNGLKDIAVAMHRPASADDGSLLF